MKIKQFRNEGWIISYILLTDNQRTEKYIQYRAKSYSCVNNRIKIFREIYTFTDYNTALDIQPLRNKFNF